VPQAFKQKLYLDVFGWIKPRSLRETPIRNKWAQADKCVNQPAIDIMRYANGKSCPTLPEDFAVPPDMRFEQGACDHNAVLSVDSKSNISFYKWEPERAEGDEDIVTGHAAEAPGHFPWVVFRNALTLLSLVWVIAAAWRFEQAFVITRRAVSWTQMTYLTQSEHVSALLDAGTRLYPQDVRELLSGNYTPTSSDQAKLLDASLPDLFYLWASGYVGSVFSKPWLELVPTTWPHAHFIPRSLSCDSSGQRFVVTDRFSVVGASLSRTSKDELLSFSEIDCPILVGEHLQDATVSCSTGSGSDCNAFVLHRHGKRLAACKVLVAGSIPRGDIQANASDISESWLERDDIRNLEKVSAIASRPFCEGDLAQCFVAHTTHGRTIQLRQRSRGHDLIPEEVLQDGRRDIQGNAKSGNAISVLRAFNSRYAGVLHTQRQSIELLDVVRGGLFAGKLLLPPQQHITSWCAGGRNLFMLSGKQVWRMPLPEKLSTV